MTTKPVTSRDIFNLLDDNEQNMGEMAAFCVTCNELGISENEAVEIIFRDEQSE